MNIDILTYLLNMYGSGVSPDDRLSLRHTILICVYRRDNQVKWQGGLEYPFRRARVVVALASGARQHDQSDPEMHFFRIKESRIWHYITRAYTSE